MRKLFIAVQATILSVTVTLSAGLSFAAAAITNYQRPLVPDIFLTEVQTASASSGGEEFIELYNNTNTDLDFSDAAHGGKDSWKLQYYPASKLAALLGTTNWSSPYRTINLTGVIAAHDYYLLAGSGYNPASLAPDQTYSSTLADDGGALQLVDSTTTGATTTVSIHDQLAWSNDKTLASKAALLPAPGAGLSLQRLPNANDQYVNSDGTLTTFIADGRISPDNAWTAPRTDPTTPVDDDDGGEASGQPSAANTGLPAPMVSELLPNPASPQTDAADEFIELYNPGDVAFDLTGYALETGTTTLHDFTFTSGAVIAPHGYQAFYAAETGLSLSNSGGQARLLDPTGQVLSESETYGSAPDGEAWVLGDNGTGWQWTTTPTPGFANLYTAPAATLASATKGTSRKAATRKLTGKTTVRKAKKAAVHKHTAKKKAKHKKQVSTARLASDTTAPVAPIHPGVLVAVGVVAVGYGLYEYRQDIANKLYQFRTNRAARRKTRG